MDIVYYNKPWEHFEVRDFLTSEEVQEVRNYFDTLSMPDGVTGKDHRQKNRHTEYFTPDRELNAVSAMIKSRFIELCQVVDSWDENEEEIHVDYERMYPGFEWHMHRDQLQKKSLLYCIYLSQVLELEYTKKKMVAGLIELLLGLWVAVMAF